MGLSPTLPVLFLCIVFHFFTTAVANAWFTDVSLSAGLSYKAGPGLKYGGPSIADLDGDGCPDLLLGHHTGRSMELYFNQCNGKFKKSNFKKTADIHAITPMRLQATQKSMHFMLSRGGLRGNQLQGPSLYRVTNKRTIIEITKKTPFKNLKQRGRGVVCLNDRSYRSKSNGFISIFITSAAIKKKSQPHAAFITQSFNRFKKVSLKGSFATDNVLFVAAIDANNDERMDIIGIRDLTLYGVGGQFQLRDISRNILPKLGGNMEDTGGCSAIAEGDFNNDGLWDLYVARSSAGDLRWRQGNKYFNHNDYLLYGQRNGKYIDAGKKIDFPLNGQSKGVTCGDFNNDGWLDILIIQHTGPDIILWNKGNGSFRRALAPWRKKRANSEGDMATAVDYDGDGRLDIILSEGSWSNRKNGGYYRIMKNISPKRMKQKGTKNKYMYRNFLRVRVGSSKSLKATSLHAKVVVRLLNGNQMMRRIGAPGVSVSVSYIETVHFGLGNVGRVASVTVFWEDGSKKIRYNVPANSYLTFGVF